MATYAPQTYRDARAYLVAELDMHPGQVVHADLDPAEVGIVGSEAHRRTGTSYHLGKSDLKMWLDPYSARLARDKRGLTDGAAALDIGEFRVTLSGGRVITHRTLGDWLLKQCQSGATDAAWIREVIWSPDGRTVLRYDRERGQRSAPRPGEADDSHLTHDHVSGYRDQEQTPKVPLFERFIREMTGDDMFEVLDAARVNAGTERAAGIAGMKPEIRWTDPRDGSVKVEPNRLAATLTEILALARAAAGDGADDIIAEVRAQGEQTRAALIAQLVEMAPTLAAQVAAELGPETAASEIGEALARELSQMLGAAVPHGG